MAAGPRRTAAGLWSRYAAARAVVPDPVREPLAFAAEISRLAAGHGDPVVYPGREEAIDALLGGPPLRLPYGDLAGVQMVRDKRRLGALARAAGLDVPAPLAEVNAAELPAVKGEFPFVVKPVRPGAPLRTAKLVHSEGELRALSRAVPGDVELLVQEYARGPQTGVAVVVAPDGELVERFQHAVKRTWPPHGGGTSMAVSVTPDDELVGRCAALLAAAGYSGLAQFDLVQAGADHHVLDINPRYYVSLPLASRCGVNLPAVWHDVVCGRAQAGPSAYRVGMRYRWFEADVTVLRHRWRPLIGPRASALWDARDPLPAMLMASRAARQRAGAFVVAKGGPVVAGARRARPRAN